jgi:hypothetical protein
MKRKGWRGPVDDFEAIRMERFPEIIAEAIRQLDPITRQRVFDYAKAGCSVFFERDDDGWLRLFYADVPYVPGEGREPILLTRIPLEHVTANRGTGN